jgi:hypothetical protein
MVGLRNLVNVVQMPEMCFQRLKYVSPATMAGISWLRYCFSHSTGGTCPIEASSGAGLNQVDPVERGQRNRVDGAPRATTVEALGLEEAD